MNKENMLKWADVLESTEYKQKHGGDIEGAYCCLNVACKVFKGVDVDHVGSISDALNDIFGEGFTDHAETFYSLNDSYRKTFPEIAVKVRELAETGNIELEP